MIWWNNAAMKQYRFEGKHTLNTKGTAMVNISLNSKRIDKTNNYVEANGILSLFFNVCV